MGRKTSSTLDEVGSKTHGDLTAENKTADIYQRKRFQISLRQPGPSTTVKRCKKQFFL